MRNKTAFYRVFFFLLEECLTQRQLTLKHDCMHILVSIAACRSQLAVPHS